jgi:hypothetical protein
MIGLRRRAWTAAWILLGALGGAAAMDAPAFAQATIYSENFDAGSPGWTLSSTNPPVVWAADATPVAGHSAPNSLNYNNGTTYDSGTANSGTAVSPNHNLTGTLNPRLQFWCRYQTEGSSSWDKCFLEVLDLSNTVLFTRQYLPAGSVATGTNETCPAALTWHQHTVTLNPAWGTIRIRFRFDTIDSIANSYQGWAIDDYTLLHDGNPGPLPQILNPMPSNGTALAASPTLTGSVVRSTGGTTVWAEFSIDGGAFVAGSAVTDWGVSAYTPPALGDGTHTYVAHAHDSAGLFSADTGVISFTVDSTAPVAGTVNDGPGPDIDVQGGRTILAANWSGFADAQSGISKYEWAIGTTVGGTNVQNYVNVGLATRASTSPFLFLQSGVTYYVTVRATNGVGATVTASSDGVAIMSLATATGLLAGQTDAAYNTTLPASFGTGPYTFTLTAGTLPPGLGMTSDGKITGTASTPGRYLFIATATDSLSVSQFKDYSIEIFPASGDLFQTSGNPSVPIELEWSAIASFSTKTLSAQGGSSPLFWKLSAGALPAGFTLDSLAGTISGTPSAPPGVYKATLTVSDSDSPTLFSSADYLFVVTGSVSPLTITTGPTLPSARMSCRYALLLGASGGVLPYTWSVSAGALPAGLTLDSSGSISGISSSLGSTPFSLTVTDYAGSTAVLAATLDTIASGAPLTISPAQLPDAVLNSPYPLTLSAQGGSEPYSWAVSSGALPPGLTLNTLTGAFLGTPTTRGFYRFVATATDAGSPAGGCSTLYTVSVLGASVPAGFYAITTPSPLPDGTLNVPYSTVLSTLGGTLPNSWVILSGQLPVGLALDGTTGAIAGTPTSGGLYLLSISALSSNGLSTAKSFTLTVPSAGAPPSGRGGGGGCGALGLEALLPLLLAAARRRRRLHGR